MCHLVTWACLPSLRVLFSSVYSGVCNLSALIYLQSPQWHVPPRVLWAPKYVLQDAFFFTFPEPCRLIIRLTSLFQIISTSMISMLLKLLFYCQQRRWGFRSLVFARKPVYSSVQPLPRQISTSSTSCWSSLPCIKPIHSIEVHQKEFHAQTSLLARLHRSQSPFSKRDPYMT